MLLRETHAEAGRRSLPAIVIVTGDVRQGKTTFMQSLLPPLARRNISVGGFLALGVHENEERTGFDLLDIATGQTTPLCTIRPLPGALQTGRFSFFEEGLNKGRELLAPENNRQHDLIFIDELGPMELNDKGWSSSVARLLNEMRTPQVWVIRRPLVEKMLDKWNIKPALVADIATDPVEYVAEVLCEIAMRFSKTE